MTQEHRNKLIRNRVALIQDLDAEAVLDHLIQGRVLTSEMAEEIQIQATRTRKAGGLLDMIPTRGDRAFALFCAALQETGQAHLAHLLEQ